MSCLSCLVFICVHCFFLKMRKLYKDICSASISRLSAEFVFLIDWRHKRLKNTIDLLLLYGDHFHIFLESYLRKHQKKHSFHNKHIYIYRSQTFWSFIKFYFVDLVHFVYILKSSHYAYILPHMHKSLGSIKKWGH